MKRNLVFLIAILFSITSFAQNSKAGNGKEKTPEQMANARTKKWTKVLTLTSEQIPQVNAIILEKIQKKNEVNARNVNKSDKKTINQELKVIDSDADTKLKSVLTQEQYDLYLKTRQENKKKSPNTNKKNIEEDDDL